MITGKRIGSEFSEKTPMAELEFFGLSVRVINEIEDKMGLIWIEDLPENLEEELWKIKNLGPKRVNRMLGALAAWRKSKCDT